MKKVAHLSSAHNRYDVRIFHKMCKSLAKNDYDTTFIVADAKKDELNEGVSILSVGEKQSNRLC